MTETTFPFPSVQEDVGPGHAEPETDGRRLALVLGGGLLAVALVGGAVFAFTGGDQVPADEVSSSGVRAPAAAPPAADQAQTVPVANTEAIARNPFEPKYVEPAPAPQQPAPADVPAALPPPLVVPDMQDQPEAMPPAQHAEAAPVAPPTTTAPREYRLVLTGVSTAGAEPVAEFTIDGAVFKAKATEVFGPHNQLLLRSLQQRATDGVWSATLQVGDAEPIDVVTNEAVFVR